MSIMDLLSCLTHPESCIQNITQILFKSCMANVTSCANELRPALSEAFEDCGTGPSNNCTQLLSLLADQSCNTTGFTQ